MKRILVTGVSGFVGGHFLDYLEARKRNAIVLGIDQSKPMVRRESYESVKFIFQRTNLLDQKSVDRLISDFMPDLVLHLASFSSVGLSWKQPLMSFCNNTNIFLNLVESLRKRCPSARVLSVGSSEEYGQSSRHRKFKERDGLNPASPYGVARVSQEMLGEMYAKSYKMKIVLTRSFNHLGVFQKPVFVVPSLVQQFIEAKKRGRKIFNLTVGNVDIVRDFTNVKDVVRAYDLLLRVGRAGDVYNVCSGKGVSLRDIILMLEKIVGIKTRLIINRSLKRPSDPSWIVGNYDKMHCELGWTPKISIEDTLKEMVASAGKP